MQQYNNHTPQQRVDTLKALFMPELEYITTVFNSEYYQEAQALLNAMIEFAKKSNHSGAPYSPEEKELIKMTQRFLWEKRPSSFLFCDIISYMGWPHRAFIHNKSNSPWL